MINLREFIEVHEQLSSYTFNMWKLVMISNCLLKAKHPVMESYAIYYQSTYQNHFILIFLCCMKLKAQNFGFNYVVFV